jgi:hypothetical protein
MASRLQAILGHLTGLTPLGVLWPNGVPPIMVETIVRSILFARHPSTAALPDFETKANTITWSPDLAKSVLEHLTTVVQTSHDQFGLAFREAYNKALEGAQTIQELAKDHPLFFLIVTLGILVIMAPGVIKLLGFTSKGPALCRSTCTAPTVFLTKHVGTGSFAATWQSTYGATVPAKSLFSYLQYMGMRR